MVFDFWHELVEKFRDSALDYDAIPVNAFASALRNPLILGLSEGSALT